MKTYEIKPMTQKGWAEIPKIYMEESYKQSPDTTSGWGQIAYDSEGIFVRLRTDEKEHRNEEFGETGMPCLDSCLEFFFTPSVEEQRYINIEINSNLCVFLGFGTCIADLMRLLPQNGAVDILKPKATKDEKGWELEYKIPLTFIKEFFPDFEISEGKKISANIYKCCEGLEPNHLLSWSKMSMEGFTFHQRRNFGEMTFVK